MLGKTLFKHVTVVDLLLVIAALAAAGALSRGMAIYLRRSFKDKIRKDNLEIIIKVIRYSIICIAVIYGLGAFGFNLSGLLVAGGIAGMVLGFASQRIVGNLISGIFLLLERPIKIGDQVQIGEHPGFVEDIRIISTTIRTYDGLYVRIPNEIIFTANIINYVNYIVRRFEYTVGIRYSDDAQKAIEIIQQVIEDHPFALTNPQPQVFVHSLGDSAVNIAVRVWSPVAEWYTVRMELLSKIKTELEAGGIEMPFPQRVVWFANGQKHQPLAQQWLVKDI